MGIDGPSSAASSYQPPLLLQPPPALAFLQLVEAAKAEEAARAKEAAAKEYRQFQADPQKFSKPFFDAVLANPAIMHPGQLKGAQLRNWIGLALQLQPGNLAAVNAGHNNEDWYDGGALKLIQAIAQQMETVGGAGADASMTPVLYASADGGVQPTALFAVQGKDGKQHLIDDRGWKYGSIDDYQKSNGLSDSGQIYLAGDNKPRAAHVTTGWGRAKQVGDIALGTAAGLAGLLMIFGSGGTAAPFLIGAASAWGIGRSVEDLVDLEGHGQPLNVITNSRARADWISLAGSAVGLGALGAGARAGAMAARTTAALESAPVADAKLLLQATAGASRQAMLLGRTATVIGGVQTLAQVDDVIENGGRMSTRQLMMALLGLAQGSAAVWSGVRIGAIPEQPGGPVPSSVENLNRLLDEVMHLGPGVGLGDEPGAAVLAKAEKVLMLGNSEGKLSAEAFGQILEHLGKSAAGHPLNTGVVARLKKASGEGTPLTGSDLNFALHELEEARLMNGSLRTGPGPGGLPYEEAHPQALKNFGHKQTDVIDLEAYRQLYERGMKFHDTPPPDEWPSLGSESFGLRAKAVGLARRDTEELWSAMTKNGSGAAIGLDERTLLALMVRVRLAEVGVDPDNPARSLPKAK